MNKNIHTLIIGDEILSGKRKDKHLSILINKLNDKNLSLNGASYIGDNEVDIIKIIKENKNNILFSFGGIGATPDDKTRHAAAKAHDLELHRHEEAKALIEKQFGEEAYPNRILMADLPKHVKLIPNEINNIPGFSIDHHHFMPGFPEMAWPMIDWILKNYYGLLMAQKKIFDQSIWIDDRSESTLIGLMNKIEQKFQHINIYSLPKMTPKKTIEFGIKGDENEVTKAMIFLKNFLDENKIKWRNN
jgi:molybdopterin-biosynthesis enzyme MoeA-like protein